MIEADLCQSPVCRALTERTDTASPRLFDSIANKGLGAPDEAFELRPQGRDSAKSELLPARACIELSS